jgi:ABC-type sugar transport system substrate-binding protein
MKMKKLLIATSAAALLAASSLAALADQASGSITSIDTSTGTVTLDDGNTYMLPQGMNSAALQVGEKVKIEFQKDNSGHLQASSVEPAA